MRMLVTGPTSRCSGPLTAAAELNVRVRSVRFSNLRDAYGRHREYAQLVAVRYTDCTKSDCIEMAGRVALGRYLPRAPTDPDVPALEHPVPRPTASPSTWSPKLSDRLTLTCLKNLDVFNMFPSIDSAGRRFAFLHWVLRGEFPSFNGTIKALRHPTAISRHFVSFAWRYLGCTRCFRSLPDECTGRAWSW